MRKAFNFYRSFYDVYKELNTKDKEAFMDALLDRQFNGVEPTKLKGMALFAYKSQEQVINSQIEGYENKTGAKLGGSVGATEGGRQGASVQEEGEEKEEGQEEGKEQVKGKGKILMSEANAFDVTEKNRNYFEAAKGFYLLFLRNSQNILNVRWNHLEKVKAEDYANDIRLLIEQDNRDMEEIREVWRYLAVDGFWMKQIQGTKKLREKFDRLITNAKNKDNYGKGKQSFTDKAAEYLAANDPDYDKY